MVDDLKTKNSKIEVFRVLLRRKTLFNNTIFQLATCPFSNFKIFKFSNSLARMAAVAHSGASVVFTDWRGDRTEAVLRPIKTASSRGLQVNSRKC